MAELSSEFFFKVFFVHMSIASITSCLVLYKVGSKIIIKNMFFFHLELCVPLLNSLPSEIVCLQAFKGRNERRGRARAWHAYLKNAPRRKVTESRPCSS